MSRWTDAADALSAALVLVAAWIALTGGGRYWLLGWVLPLRSAALLLYAAGAIQVLRHVLRPQPSLRARIVSLDRAISARPALAAALRPFVATRVAVFAVALFSVLTIGFPPAMQGELRVSNDPVINLPARFDAGWYGGIALDGYDWGRSFALQQSIAFFPAMPLLARGVAALVGSEARGVPREARMARVLWSGVLLSLAALLWGLVYFVRLGREMIGADRAADAAMLLAAYPFAVYYSAPYTEGLFFLGASGAFFHFRREQWIAAASWGLLAGLSRPNGCLLSIPLALLAWQQLRDAGVSLSPSSWRMWGRPAAIRLAAASASGIGMLIFTVYLYGLTGVWFAWAKSHAAWGRSFQGLEPFAAAFEQLSREPFMQVIGNAPYEALNAVGLLFAAALVWPTFSRLGLAWGAFVVVNMAGPLLAGGVLSLGRLTSTLFPLFLALAVVLPPRAVPACTAAFALLQGLAAALFFTWRDLY